MPKKKAGRGEPDTWTKGRQFRLGDDTMAELDFLAAAWKLSRAAVFRLVVTQRAKAEGYRPPKKTSEKTPDSG